MTCIKCGKQTNNYHKAYGSLVVCEKCFTLTLVSKTNKEASQATIGVLNRALGIIPGL